MNEYDKTIKCSEHNKRKLNSIGCPPTPQKLKIFSLVKKKMLKTGGWARVVFAPQKMYLLTHP